MPNQPRLYLYPDDELKEKIQKAAASSKMSVSTWLKQAALEKLRRDRRKEEKSSGRKTT